MLLKELTKEPTVALAAYANSILTSKRVTTSNIVATCVCLLHQTSLPRDFYFTTVGVVRFTFNSLCVSLRLM